MKKPFLFALAILGLLQAALAGAAQFDHGPWDGLLKRHVVSLRNGSASQVDYDGMRAEEGVLKAYLATTSAVRRQTFERWDKAEQLAFLINSYNAWTVEYVLTGYPGIQSIKDLGSFFQSPWKKRFIPFLDDLRSLDDIEQGLIRESGRYNDPRIHFAVNCASIGCPALRPEAYRPDRLDAQLEEAAQRFLADKTRNRPEGQTLAVSRIFKWYREDFENGWRGSRGLEGFLVRYRQSLSLNDEQARRLVAGAMDIGFTDYDWRLNRKP